MQQSCRFIRKYLSFCHNHSGRWSIIISKHKIAWPFKAILSWCNIFQVELFLPNYGSENFDVLYSIFIYLFYLFMSSLKLQGRCMQFNYFQFTVISVFCKDCWSDHVIFLLSLLNLMCKIQIVSSWSHIFKHPPFKWAFTFLLLLLLSADIKLNFYYIVCHIS